MLLDSVTYAALVVGIWLFVLLMPLLLFLAVRFLWYRHVYLGHSRAVEELVHELRRIARALEERRAADAPAPKPDGAAVEHHVANSMFGR